MGICGRKNAVQFGSGFELWKIKLEEKSGPNCRGSGYKSLSKPALQLITLLESNRKGPLTKSYIFLKNLNKKEILFFPLNSFIHLGCTKGEQKFLSCTLCYFQTRDKFLVGRKSQVLLLRKYSSQSLHHQQAIIHGPSSQMIRWHRQQQLGLNSETISFIDFISQLTRLCWEVKMHCTLYH